MANGSTGTKEKEIGHMYVLGFNTNRRRENQSSTWPMLIGRVIDSLASIHLKKVEPGIPLTGPEEIFSQQRDDLQLPDMCVGLVQEYDNGNRIAIFQARLKLFLFNQD